MTEDFLAAMGRATETVRAGDPFASTRIIQDALASGSRAQDVPQVASPSTVAKVRAHRMRRPLGDVIRVLARGRHSLNALIERGRTIPLSDPPMPDGAAFRRECFASSAGSRSYRLYVPASARDGLQGLVVMLHGCTQTPEDFATGTDMNALAERHHLLVAYPGQSRGDNVSACWNWFRPGDQLRDTGEPAILAGLTRGIIDAHEVPENAVFAAGLSAGGAMAAILGETYPEMFSAIGVHSGLAYGAANDVVSAFAAMRGETSGGFAPARRSPGDRPRVIVFHGVEDRIVHPSNARQIVAATADCATTAVKRGTAGGRDFARAILGGPDGRSQAECWMIDGAGHAWSGGRTEGSHTDPTGPDASAEMVRFFLQIPDEETE